MPSSTRTSSSRRVIRWNFVAVERVEADVHPVEPGVAQLVGEQAERGAVGGDRRGRASARRTARPTWPGTRSWASLCDEHRQVGADGGLAAGEAQAVDLEALDEDAGQPLDLLEREHLAARQPLHALLRHAVRAAEVAAVGDRDAQVADRAPERVDQVHRVTLPSRQQDRARRSRRAATPSPSGTTAMALASEVAASWWLPWAPTDRDVHAAVGAERGEHPHVVDLAVGPAGQAVVGDRVAPSGGRATVWPTIRRSAGRASSSKLTSELTGLPGRPNTGTAGRRRGEQTERERLGRLDRDLHPAHVGDPRQHRLHDVVVAHADAAAGDDGVARRPRVGAAPPRARPRRRGRCRGRRPRSRRRATSAEQHRAVALADLARAAAASRRRPARRRCDSTATRARGTTATVAALTLASTPATAGRDERARRRTAGAGAHVVAGGAHGVARLDRCAGSAPVRRRRAARCPRPSRRRRRRRASARRS